MGHLIINVQLVIAICDILVLEILDQIKGFRLTIN